MNASQPRIVPDRLLKAAGDTYSADKIMEGKIRGWIQVDGQPYVCTGSGHMGEKTLSVQLQRLELRKQYTGRVFTYNEKAALVETDQDRETFYEGMAVKWKGVQYVLAPGKITLTSEPEKTAPVAAVATQMEMKL